MPVASGRVRIACRKVHLANKSCQIGAKPAAVHSMSLFPAFCFGHSFPEPLRVSTACRVESPYYVYTSSSLQYCRLVYDSSSKSDAQQRVLRPAAFKHCESYVTVCMPHTSAYGRLQVAQLRQRVCTHVYLVFGARGDLCSLSFLIHEHRLTHCISLMLSR